MRIVIPEKIEILSYTFSVIQDKSHGGGSFSFGDNQIVIGTKNLLKDPSYTFNVICHEIMEIIHVISSTRYDDASVSGNYKFFQDHKEFENNINLFAKIIQNFIK